MWFTLLHYANVPSSRIDSVRFAPSRFARSTLLKSLSFHLLAPLSQSPSYANRISLVPSASMLYAMALLFLLVCVSVFIPSCIFSFVSYCHVHRMQASIKRPCSGLCDGLVRARDQVMRTCVWVFDSLCVLTSD
jgi:hypothetical protein